MQLDHPDERKQVRAAAGLTGTPYPIVVVPGEAAPRLTGHEPYWTTPSGKTEVAHPNAYGWPTLYRPSTRRIEVGADWLVAVGIWQRPQWRYWRRVLQLPVDDLILETLNAAHHPRHQRGR